MNVVERAIVDINTNLLTRTPVFICDQSHEMSELLYQPFAYGDVFLRYVNQNCDQIFLHIWPMDQTVILGMIDRRLPYCDEGIKAIRTHGYRTVVRNVGGLAVVADSGVFNFSLVFAKRSESISIQEAYVLMMQLIQTMFYDCNVVIDYYEIVQSYCPGAFDLSINGKKFAGIAQRRFKDGIAVSIYLSVCGNQQQRGEIIREFYDRGKNGETTNYAFPVVDPSTMENLDTLLNIPLSINDVKERLLQTLTRQGIQLYPFVETAEFKQDYRLFYDKMIERNRRV